MKGIIISPLLLWPVLACATFSPLTAAPADLRDLLRDGLYKEEVDRDPDGAAKAYQELLVRNDEQRAFAATAQFRLAEVRRKQGRKDEAIEAYRQLLIRYPEAETEGKLARENLTTLGAPFQTEEDSSLPNKSPDEQTLERIRNDALSNPDRLNNEFYNNAVYGYPKTMDFLLDHCNPPPEISLLKGAEANGSLEVVELLLKRGADPKDPGNREALIGAVVQNQAFILKALLAAGFDVNSTIPGKGDFPDLASDSWPSATTPLTAAVGTRNTKFIDLLLEAKADVNLPAPPANLTPLHVAVWMKDSATAKRLLAAGANPNALTQPLLQLDGQLFPADTAPVFSPLDLALRNGDDELATILDKAGAKVHFPNHLALAVSRDQVEQVQLLLKHGLDASTLKSETNVFLQKHPTLLPLLIEHGMKVRDELMDSLIQTNQAGSIALILDHKAYPQDRWNYSRGGSIPTPEMRRLMLEHGWGVYSDDLCKAIVEGNEKELRFLLDHGANPHVETNGVSSFAMSPSPAIAEILLEKGLNIHSKLWTPSLLTAAVKARRADLVKVLLEHGADPGEKSLLETALPDPAIANLLIDKGARPDKDWQARGFPDPSGSPIRVSPDTRALLFRKFTLPEMEDSRDVRFVVSGPMWESAKVKISALEEQTNSPKPRPLAERLYQLFSQSPDRDSKAKSLPDTVIIWRKKSAAEGYRKIDVKLTDPAAYPALEWGDVVDLLGPENRELGQLTPLERQETVASHVAFPMTLEMDGKVHELRMSGKTGIFDPTRPLVPVMTAGKLIATFFPEQAIEYRGSQNMTVIRKDWPQVKMDSSAQAYQFDLTAGDRLVVETRPDIPATPFRAKNVSVVSPSLPFLKLFSTQFQRTNGGSPNGFPAPTLFQVIAESYAYPDSAEVILPHPDFSHLHIKRLHEQAPDEIIDVDLQAAIDALPSGFTREEALKLDVPLLPGDIVELPVLKDRLDTPWSGFSPALAGVLRKALSCQVQITNAQGQIAIRNFNYEPPIYSRGPDGIEGHAPATGSCSLRLSSIAGKQKQFEITTLDGLGKVSIGSDWAFISDRMTYLESQYQQGQPVNPVPFENR